MTAEASRPNDPAEQELEGMINAAFPDDFVDGIVAEEAERADEAERVKRLGEVLAGASETPVQFDYKHNAEHHLADARAERSRQHLVRLGIGEMVVGMVVVAGAVSWQELVSRSENASLAQSAGLVAFAIGFSTAFPNIIKRWTRS